MSTTDDLMQLAAEPRPEGWTDARETRVRAIFDRLVAAIMAGDDDTASRTMIELHDVECEIAHRLFTEAMLQDTIVMIIVDERGTT